MLFVSEILDDVSVPFLCRTNNKTRVKYVRRTFERPQRQVKFCTARSLAKRSSRDGVTITGIIQHCITITVSVKQKNKRNTHTIHMLIAILPLLVQTKNSIGEAGALYRTRCFRDRIEGLHLMSRPSKMDL